MDILGSSRAIDDEARKVDFVNLYATTPSGQQIKSSTFHLIGEDYDLALGINYDFTSLVFANRVLLDLMSADADLQSAMWRGGEDRLGESFDECLAAIGKPVSALSKARPSAAHRSSGSEERRSPSARRVPYVSQRLGVSPLHRLQVPKRKCPRRRSRRTNMTVYTVYSHMKAVRSVHEPQSDAYCDDLRLLDAPDGGHLPTGAHPQRPGGAPEPGMPFGPGPAMALDGRAGAGPVSWGLTTGERRQAMWARST